MVYFYQESPGNVPVWDWVQSLRVKDRRRYKALFRALILLTALGSDLRRPQTAALGNGLFELRRETDGVQLRLIFFYVPGGIAVVAHHLIKKTQAVPRSDIELALQRKRKYELDPDRHTFGDPGWWIERSDSDDQEGL